MAEPLADEHQRGNTMTTWQLLSLQAPPNGARCEYIAIMPDVYATHGEGVWHKQDGNVQWRGFIQDGVLPQIFTSDPASTVWRLVQPEATWRPVRIALAEQPGQVRAWGTTAQLSTEDLAALTQPDRNGIQSKQAIEKLSRLPRHDEQEAHSDADGILLDLLKAIGYKDVADAYEQARKKIGFWYA